MKMTINPIVTFEFGKGYTHGGVFHADDVFSTALLKLLNPNIVIERGFKPPEDDDVIVFDIGMGQYDHHQKDNECREDGTPYAAFGKLWREFGHQLMLSEEGWETIESKLVKILDHTDNTGQCNTLSMSISSFNPSWNSSDSSDDKFWEAVDFAKTVLQNLIIEQNSIVEAEIEAETAYQKATSNGNTEIIILDRFAPVQKYFSENHSEVKFTIFPSQRVGYNILAVKDQDGNNRVSFPEDWLGNIVPEIGLTFCHPGNFMASGKDLPSAIKIAELAIEQK